MTVCSFDVQHLGRFNSYNYELLSYMPGPIITTAAHLKISTSHSFMKQNIDIIMI